MQISIENGALANFIAKRRWIRRLKVFALPEMGKVRWRDKEIFVDLRDWKGPSYHALNWGVDSYEKENYELLKAICPRDGVLFDIGANIGLFSLRLASELPNLKVHAFEPEPKTQACLLKSVDANDLATISVHKEALSDHRGVSTFYVDEQNHGGHSLNADAIREDGNAIGSQIQVPVVTTDEFVSEKKIKRLDIVKLDVQRHEESVLRGAMKTIKDFRPIVMMECYFDDLDKKNRPLFAPFFNAGDYWFVEPLSGVKSPLEAFTSSSIFAKTSSRYVDLFFTPKEKLDLFHG